MENAEHIFGLVGRRLGHSWSQRFFKNLFWENKLAGYDYRNFEVEDISQIEKLVHDIPQLRGLNVTVPYKQAVIPFLHALDEEAREIGAVNCISIVNGRMHGYNTDAFGFAEAARGFLGDNHVKALILGTGGSARAVAFALRKMGMDCMFVTSSPAKQLRNVATYAELDAGTIADHRLIVNCTPLGMWPDVNLCPPFPFHLIGSGHFAFDLIYNPETTLFMMCAAANGAAVTGGGAMLAWQALRSWDIWNGRDERTFYIAS